MLDHTPTHTDAYAGLIEDLASRTDELASAAAEAIQAEIPSYARVWDQVGEGVREVCRVTYERLIDAWRGGAQPTQDDFRRLGRIGVTAPELGISLEEVLHAYRISGRIVIDALSAASDEHAADPHSVLDAVYTAFYYLNDLSAAISSEGLRREHARLQRLDDAERELIRALVARPPQPDEANRIGRLLGLQTLAGPWVASMFVPSSTDAHPTDAAAALADTARSHVRATGAGDLFAAVIDGRVIVVSRPIPGGRLPALDRAIVGVSAEHSGPPGIRKCYDEAAVSLDVALRNRQPTAHFDLIWLDRVLMGSVSPEELAAVVLQPLSQLPESKRRDWEETLESYLMNGRNVTETARTLHVHPHTVRYRLGQLERLLGASFGSHDQRLALQVALRARRQQRRDAPRGAMPTEG